MLTRRRILVSVMALCLAAWLSLLGYERWVLREPEDFTRIEEGLYMGGYVSEPPPGTTAVLNLCGHEDQYACDIHLWESIRDGAPAPDLEWLRRMVDWVDARRRADGTVYVHCFAGVSRSGMVVAAYLMFKHGWSRDQALAFIKSKRPNVRPNGAFMALLEEWERALKASSAVRPKRAPALQKQACGRSFALSWSCSVCSRRGFARGGRGWTSSSCAGALFTVAFGIAGRSGAWRLFPLKARRS